MERTVNSFPIQRLPLSRKTEEWRKDCVDYIIGASGISSSENIPDEDELQSYYDLYNSIYNEKDLKYVTNPFNQDDGFPATTPDYNIIRPKNYSLNEAEKVYLYEDVRILKEFIHLARLDGVKVTDNYKDMQEKFDFLFKNIKKWVV